MGSTPGGIDFQQLAQLAGDPIVVQEGDRIAWANPAAAALVGASHPREVIGRPVLEFVPEELQPMVIATMTAVLATGQPAPPKEQTLKRLDGTRVEVEILGSALGPARILLVIRDISGRRQAEAAKRAAEQRLRAFFELSSDPMAIARDGRYDFANVAFARLFGYDQPEQVVGVGLLELFALSERARIVELGRRRAAGEQVPPSYVSRGLRRDGTEFEAELRAFGFREEGSTFTAAIVRDVTEERARAARLQESERRYRELFDFVPVSLWEVDASGIRKAVERIGAGELRARVTEDPQLATELMRSIRVVAVNGFGCAQAGAESQEELAANLEKVHVPDSFPRYRELGLQLLAGAAVARAEGWSGTLSGERRWLGTSATVLPGHEATWERVLFASVDLTDRRRAEEERTALQERLRQAEKLEAVGRLAGGVAHDFNNILSGILGYAELTALELDPRSELREHQQRIREAALRARDLVRQILTFSRRDRSSRRQVDVPLVVREALALMRTGIPATATLDVRIDADAGAALADPTQLHQIVLNLCANARDAIGVYGRIEVAVSRVELTDEVEELQPGPYVRIRVRDDGVGMDAATRARLFEPFLTTKGPRGGHGLGLAVVHGIVTASGGAIHVESAPGEGSTFDVYLPRQELDGAEPPAPPVRAAGKGERILLVDDEPMVLTAHRRLLESLGYAVETAADGVEALARFRATPHAFDLVLTDQAMPRLSGVDLACALLAVRADARILLCTGYSDRVDDAEARRLGLCGLLSKPMDRDELATAIQRALRRG